jgi:3-dehydroquinate dehydratase/shikimate dehydrogenase
MGPFGNGISRVCAVAAASTAPEMATQVHSVLRKASTIELRLDWLTTDAQRIRFLTWLRRTQRRGKGSSNRPRRTTFLATCRRKGAGGLFPGDIEAQLYWLIQAREAGCQWCDIEIETFRELPGQSVREYAVPPRVMLSLHDFERTPALRHTVRPPAHGQVDAVKIAATARTIADSVRLLHFARRSKNCIASPMGELGLPARILSLREGSALTYAPINHLTAPGQISFAEMTQLYRAHTLNRQTKIYGVIADPVGHSLSPLLHNSAFAAKGLNAVYLPFLVRDLRDFLPVIPEFGIRGFSVTIPHKQTILKYLKDCDPLAADIGAVNTVTVDRHGALHGSNTDYVGVLHSLERKFRLAKSRVLVFGAGGAARAAAFALARAGAAVAICARRPAAGRELARAVGGEVVPRRALRSESFDAILNSTPIGMHPATGISPLTSAELHCRIVMDLIYRPERTRLLQLAASKGIATVSGAEMFLAQGIAQWELWTRQRAPEAVMRRAVVSVLRSESSASSMQKQRYARVRSKKARRPR